MHVQPISTFRLFQEGHLLRNSIAIFVLTTLFYFIGAELRLVHELSLFWPLNGVMAGVFARYVWLNRLHYYAISYVAMLVYDAITTEWGLVSLAINFSNMMFIVTVALLVARDKRLGKNKYEPVSALRLFNYCLLAALLCAIVGAIGSVSIDTLDFWPLLADWFSEQFSTGVLIVPCMLTLAIPGVLPRFKAEQMMPGYRAYCVGYCLGSHWRSGESGVSAPCINLVCSALYAASNMSVDLCHRRCGSRTGGKFGD